MQHGIREFRPRQPLDRQLDANTFNRILREIESLRITSVVNGLVRKLPGGTEIVIPPQRGGGSSSAPQPWDLSARVDPAADPSNQNPPYFVKVRPGTVNGFLATNWNEEFLCAGTELHYAKAVITTDAQAITGVTIEIDTTAPTTQEPQQFSIQTEITYLFGLFAEGQVWRVIGAGHINLVPEHWLTTATASPAAPGELPWIQYFNLQ